MHQQNSIKGFWTPPRERTPPIPAPRRSTVAASTAPPSSRSRIFVPTAVIKIIDNSGNRLARTLLNPSLTTSRIAVSCVREWGLNPFKIEDKTYVKVIVEANVFPPVRYDVCMLVVKDLPRTPYTSATESSFKEKFCRIALADPEFYSNAPVPIEIGGDLYTSILRPNVIHIDGGSVVAQDSSLGWLVMGSISNWIYPIKNSSIYNTFYPTLLL